MPIRKTRAVLIGHDEIYDELPWFWSSKYDLKLQFAGLSRRFDDFIIRGTPDDKCFSCLCLRDVLFLAINSVNAPKDFLLSERLVPARGRIDRRVFADTSISYEDMAYS